ncbi:hypothetical protein [Streptomyces sp. NPDC051173]|uniref:hypothetical protein n=1 Tax=Streptomyces sp. NPDC051173 TaxID=3155164 RepID=UPI00344F8351
MSDAFDPDTSRTVRRLMDCYDLLTEVCASLPLPISLPQEVGPGHWSDRADAVARTAELAYEVPASWEVRDSLKCACLFWLAASDLLLAQAMEPKRYRPEAATAVLLTAEDYLHDTRRDLGIEG